ncbi:MAG: chemotaxis protein CheD [Desulfobacteraceae bacterium]|nr:chemotaxis protein CheD [Desulfobacteraceae bacterium]
METNASPPIVGEYLLKPGFIYLPRHPTAISAVLGSSVSICLYDQKLGIGGMNHFLFPCALPPERPTAKYGNVAITALIRMMLKNGATLKNMEAQMIGGAFHPKIMSRDIGRNNLETARTMLKKRKIRIVSEDVGGEIGRKIVFNTTNCEIAVLKVGRLRSSDWYPYEENR